MTENEISNLIRRNSSSDQKTISTELGLQATMEVTQIADLHNVAWALAGGIAMHLYGFVRATTDVDVIGSSRLPLTGQKNLSFGGESYTVQVGKETVSVDWIVRDDEFQDFYEAALNDLMIVENNLQIISPEWLVILKHFSGRAKDEIDLIWLLQQENLVDRETVKQNLIKVLGKRTGIILAREFQSHFDYADVLKMREQSKYEA